MTEQLLENMLQDEHGYYAEKELIKNWINTDKIQDIAIQLSRQVTYNADKLYTKDKTIDNLLKQINNVNQLYQKSEDDKNDLKTDLDMAERLLKDILKIFNMEEYDIYYDQNEIMAKMREIYSVLKK